MINKKYELFKEPYIRKADYKYYGTKNIIIDFIISLLPVILAGWYQNGVKVFINNKSFYSLIYPLLFVMLGGIFTFLIETLYFYFFDKSKSEYSCVEQSLKSYSIIPGLLLAIILPLKTPLWVLFIGCVFASFIGKIIYGGFGHNIFNPALVGYIFLMTAFYGVINSGKSDIVSSSTPLVELNNILFNNKSIEEVINSNGGLIKVCFGLKTGTIGETSSIACFVSLVYLSVRNVIDIKTPLIVLGTFYLSCILIGLFIDTNIFQFSLFNLFNGGIIFGSIFMATEPVTSPRSYYGKIFYALFIGLIAIVLRLLSDLRDGTSTAILFMNSISLIIDSFGAKIRVMKSKLNKLFKLSIISLLFIILNGYCVLKINSYKVFQENNDEIIFELYNIKQDYKKLEQQNIEFIYYVKINDKEISLNCDINGNILSDINNFTIEEQEKLQEEIVKNKINKRSLDPNKHYGYIKDVQFINDGEYIITSYARGYFNDVIIIVNYKNNNIESVNVDLSKETELSGGLANSTGTKKDLIEIGEGKSSDIVSGVTYTSVSLLSARNAIVKYIEFLNGGFVDE